MANLTVKNIPDDLYEKLKRSAEINRRSINSELIVCLEEVLCAQREISAEEHIAAARALRESIGGGFEIDEDELNAWKNEGRE